MTKRWFAGLIASVLALPSAALAQSPAPLFAGTEPLHLTIQAPLASLVRDRTADAAIDGTLVDPAGHSLPIRLTLRGITRRTAEICEFPPLRVDFTMPPPANSIFAGQRRLKLVTHCRNSTSFQKYALLEYAAYRLYNQLTPRSFGARLAAIDYRGADGRPIVARTGFFIEDFKDVARRNGMRPVHGPERIPVTSLSPADAARYAMFEQLIGNHDWSMRAGPVGEDCCHNAKLIGDAAPGATIPIPYDFDYSGFVGAPYATPPAELAIANVRQRLYRGYCAHNAEAVAAVRQMQAARPQMLAALAGVPGLDPRTASSAAAYLDQFFASVASDGGLRSTILARCVR